MVALGCWRTKKNMRTRHFSSSDPVPSSEKERHQPVLLHEVVRFLDVQKADIVVDATLGAAGHAQALAKGLGGNGLFIGLDLDEAALLRASRALKASTARVVLISANFRDLAGALRKRDISTITKVLFDLGMSSYQLNLDSGLPAKALASAGRGFSFTADEPLIMTYRSNVPDSALTAATIVNTWKEQSLADVIYGFGGERRSRKIARAIVERRKEHPFKTSRELADLIATLVPRRGRIHPATKTFQALRIAVNDELGALSAGLESAWELLAPHGRIAVITFHSLEDRIVKQMFAAWEKHGEGTRLNKKPIVPTREEMRSNRRSRSAKLRVIQKISHAR